MSGLPSLTILSEEQKFNGENLLQWKINITQLLGSKGLLGYVDGKVSKPSPSPSTQTPEAQPTTATPIYSSSPTLDEWVFRDQLARGHITLNCTDVTSLGVKTDGTAKEAWDSILTEWGTSTDMRRSHAQEALNGTLFVEGSDISEHIKLLRTRKAAVDNLSTSAMSEETWRGVIIRSIPPTTKWLPVIPSLYAMTSSADIVSTLFAHGMILGRDLGQKSSSQSNTALIAKSTDSCTNPRCKAKKRTTHTIENCYWPGGGKEGQFPPNFGQRAKANAAASGTPPSATEQTEHFALSTRISNMPGQSGVVIHDDLDPEDLLRDGPERPIDPEITDCGGHPLMAFISKAFQGFEQGRVPTFLDSGASDTMFVSKDVFTEYKPITSRMGDSAKAKDGGFEIMGEGSVYQRYRVDGKDRDITYTRALHTPSLNANLVSVSALDKAGLIVTFGHGRGVVQKEDGKVVLTGNGVNGMYLLETVENKTGVPKAMASSSLSQPTTIEQWHRRLTHCSPLTIKDMVNKNLVDGLIISEGEIRGKCEHCILGR
jgi:GAG-pre-integrase domain/gag-polypeptide of LTR copia-type